MTRNKDQWRAVVNTVLNFQFHKMLLTFKVAELLKSSIFWAIMSCSPLQVNRRFGGTYHLYLQGRKVSQERNQRKAW
jgi:hypothetical protein